MPSTISEFDEAYDDANQDAPSLTCDVLEQPIRLLEPAPAVLVSMNSSVADTVKTMNDALVGCVLVMDGRKLAGIFTDRDVVRRVLPTGLPLEAAKVGDYMTPDPDVLGPDDPVAFALNRMSLGDSRHVPLVDDAGQPLSVVSVRNVVNFVIQHFAGPVQNLPPTPSRRVTEYPPHGAA